MSEQPVEDDRQLVKRVAASDRQALTELYTRYQRPLFNYLLQFTPDYGLAEELLQDTLVAVWKSAASFEQRSSVLTWLFGIARRQAHNSLRRHSLQLVDESALEMLPAPDPEPEEFALATFAREELIEAFKQLTPVHREVLVLVLLQDLSYEETATVLCVPIGTVKSRLNHAKRLIRTLLITREEAEK